MKFNELKGDFTDFVRKQDCIHFICHVVNSSGAYGSGAIMAIEKKYPRATSQYTAWYEGQAIRTTFPRCLEYDNYEFQLGNIQVVKVAEGIRVINMLAQKSFRSRYKIPPGKYEALEECLYKVNDLCEQISLSGYIPIVEACKFGSMRSQLSWDKIFDMVQRIFKDTEGIWNTYSYEGPTK